MLLCNDETTQGNWWAGLHRRWLAKRSRGSRTVASTCISGNVIVGAFGEVAESLGRNDTVCHDILRRECRS